ncbi:unnamed protein product [Closterium sp. Yama58-4]|nr:unnamed protein product [Closterium sp. Yama58-4]
MAALESEGWHVSAHALLALLAAKPPSADGGAPDPQASPASAASAPSGQLLGAAQSAPMSAQQVRAAALDLDLRRFGEACLPDDVNRAEYRRRPGKLFVQVVSVSRERVRALGGEDAESPCSALPATLLLPRPRLSPLVVSAVNVCEPRGGEDAESAAAAADEDDRWDDDSNPPAPPAAPLLLLPLPLLVWMGEARCSRWQRGPKAAAHSGDGRQEECECCGDASLPARARCSCSGTKLDGRQENASAVEMHPCPHVPVALAQGTKVTYFGHQTLPASH